MKVLYFSVNMQKYTSASYQQDFINCLKKKVDVVFWGPGYENFDINLDLSSIKKNYLFLTMIASLSVTHGFQTYQ